VGTGTYTLSVFVKAGTVSSLTLAAFYTGNSTQGFSFGFNASTGLVTGGSGSVESAGDGWYRIYFTVTGTNALNNTLRFQVYINTTGTLYLWGAQINVGSFVRPYTATTAAAITASTVWSNVSGQVNNGTLTNGPTYNTANAGAVVFDGVNDSVTVAISNFFTSYSEQITIEAWIYVPASAVWNNAYEGVIVGRGNYAGSHGLFRSLTNNQVRAWFRQSGATYGAVFSSGSITRDAWHQCVAVWTGTAAQLYINGNLIQTTSGTLGSTISNESFVIGGNNTAGGAEASYFTGSISNVKIYNRTLSAAEIQQNFNALRGRYSI
jgi:hypothetical protein